MPNHCTHRNAIRPNLNSQFLRTAWCFASEGDDRVASDDTFACLDLPGFSGHVIWGLRIGSKMASIVFSGQSFVKHVNFSLYSSRVSRSSELRSSCQGRMKNPVFAG